MSDDQEKQECLGCVALLGNLSWAFSYMDPRGAVVCTTCGKEYKEHPMNTIVRQQGESVVDPLTE